MDNNDKYLSGSRRFTYSRWDGTQQISELDANSLMEALGDELIENGDPNFSFTKVDAKRFGF